MMTKKKLKYKIFIYLVAFSAMIIGLLWFFQTVFLRDMYKIIRTGELKSAISYVEDNITSENFGQIAETLEIEKDIIVRKKEDFVKPKKGNSGGPMQKDQRLKPEELVENRTFVLEDGSELELSFYALITPVEATTSTLKSQLLIVTGVSLFLAVLIAILVAKRISKPIEDLNNSAKELGKGEFKTDFNAKGYLEIEELAQTLNKTSKELSKVDEFRRELMANISHDLRTPLALIYSYAEMMSDFPEEISPDSLKVIMDEALRLKSLVNDVLDVSNMESGQMQLKAEYYSLTEDIKDIVARINSMVNVGQYKLNFFYDDNIDLWADKLKIGQVMYNLIINAINHSGENKDISIRQTLLNDRVLIEVIDKGQGISEEDLKHIWDRYYKGSQSHKRPVVGSGLGLSIVKKVIDLHGGSCGVDSKPGDGANFYFYLPIGQANR